MTEELPERDLLRTIDPAPRIIDPLDQQRHLRLVLRRIETRRTAARAPLRLLAIGAPILGATLAVAILLPSLTRPAGTPVPLASDSAPVASGQAIAIRAGDTTRAGVRVLASARVDDALMLLGERDGQQRFGASFGGSDPDRNWDLFRPAPATADGVTIGEVANFPDAVRGGVSVVAGSVGADVVSVEVRTVAGDVVPAQVSDGLYLVAWRGRDFADRSTLGTAFVLHLRDGATRTVTYLSLTGG